MYVIGVTGPMGAGKSVVLETLASLGARVLRADDASRELLARDARLLTEIQHALGEGVFQADGTLDRRRAAQLIFSNDGARARLEAVMHPPMVRWLERELQRLRHTPDAPPLVALEAAILTHMGARRLVDAVVRVHASPEDCVARLQARDGISAAEAQARLALHERLGLFSEPADYVVESSGTVKDTRRRVEELWPILLEKADRQGA